MEGRENCPARVVSPVLQYLRALLPSDVYSTRCDVSVHLRVLRELTPWMNKEYHAFLLEFRPTWGDRGSDSQEYRKMGKLHKPPLERTIGEPEGGWVGRTYMVRIALRKSKDIHNAILHAPYLDEFDRPTGGNIWVPHLGTSG